MLNLCTISGALKYNCWLEVLLNCISLLVIFCSFSLGDYQVGVDVLKNKVVIIFISRMDEYPEKLLLIIQQSRNKSLTMSEEPYEIVWLPTNFSAEVGERTHNQIADMIPWYSISEPSKVSPSVMKFIQQVWHFKGEPMMVVLDSYGKVLSLDAFDMIAIWGPKAYPFTISRERELWEEQSWTMNLLLDDIDPLLSYWVSFSITLQTKMILIPFPLRCITNYSFLNISLIS